MFINAQVCSAARDFPLGPVAPPPVFSTVEGHYDFVYAAKGTFARGGKATLTLDLPGPPVGAYLYLAGNDPIRRKGDPEVRVKISHLDSGGRPESVTTLTRVPVLYATTSQPYQAVGRVEITPYVSAGRNTIAISGFGLAAPEAAFAYAVFTAGDDTPLKLIQVQDGADIGYYAEPPPLGPDSEVVSFQFDPSLADRPARMLLAVTDGDAGRGDEVFGFTGTGVPTDQLADTDGDGRIDIVDRSVKLKLKDGPPAGVDPANSSGALEADARAFSLEEDCLGEPPRKGGCGIGQSFNIVARPYTIPAGHAHADFQVQSENPERGDSYLVVFALNEVLPPDINVFPEIEVVKTALPTELPEPGGPVTFTVTVNNLSAEGVRLATLVDDFFGDVTTVHGLISATTCALPQSIAVLGSYGCTFTAGVSGTVQKPHHDTVTGTGTGEISGLPCNASDDAVVTFTPPARGSIGDRVWLDADRDGVQDGGETGIDGMTVHLRDAGANIIATTTTATVGGVVGFYTFTNLPAGTYTVETVPLVGVMQTYDLDGLGTPNKATRALAADEAATDVDFGYAPLVPPDFTLTKTASIDAGYPGDRVTYVFVVTNTGGVRLENLTVTDDKFGNLGAVSLDPGESATLYRSDYPLPVCGTAGLTVPNRCDGTAGTTGFCSLPNTATATWRTLTRTASECVDILPFGSIGDFVWEDRDKDGVQDAGEPGIPGATVALLKGGVAVATTTTNAAGWYLFANLKAGAYTVDPAGVSGHVLTTANDPLDVALGIGQNYLLADFGYWKPAPDIRVVKTATPTDVLAGTPVTYTFVVTNTGDAVLVEIDVTDDKLGYIGTIPRLAVGASATLTKVVPAPACGTGGTTNVPCSFAAGVACLPEPDYCYLRNVATARGYEEIFRTVVTDDDDACIRIRTPVPKIKVEKTADPTFGYLFTADPTTPWPYALIPTPLKVAYTAEVSNPGEEPLVSVALTDDPATLVFSYQSGDANGDGALDLTETWIYSATWTYTAAGTYPDTVTASGTGAYSGTRVSAQASALVKAVGCGQCLGKVSTLTLRWNGAGSARIQVVSENDKFLNPVAFNGTVAAGGTFSFGPLFSTLSGFNGTLGTNISLYVDGVFSATIHTSCSQPIYPGQSWGPSGAAPSGPFTVVSGTSKQGGLLCPIADE